MVLLGALESRPGRVLPWVAGLAAIGLAGTYAVQRATPLVRVLLLAEILLVAAGATMTGGGDSPLLPYLAASALTAGVRLGSLDGFVLAGAAAASLLAGRLSYDGSLADERQFTAAAAQWSVVFAMLVLGSGALRIADRSAPTVAERYAEAYRLLGQLRAVSRRLPGSLDPGTVGTVLLDRAAAVTPYRRGAVLLTAEQRLVPLALRGTRRVPWRVTKGEPGPVRDALTTRRPVVDRRHPDTDGGQRRKTSTLLALPICAEDRIVGVVVLESSDPEAFPDDVVEQLETVAGDSGLPLETASLFEELRLDAAAQERSRLAHEMHDGIAQDLAYVGYELDALTARLRSGSTEAALEEARTLRRRITDIVGDLRLSITDLKSSIGPSRGLGLALSEYARSAGTAGGQTVHVSLREATTRLPSELEIGLLRIAHEAIGSARRRKADNLWVTLVADPPAATLIVEDDAATAADAATVDVMRERAQEVGARLDVGVRVPSGMRVRVDVAGGG